MNILKKNDLWKDDEFEDLVARAIIGQSERNINKKWRGKNVDSHLRVSQKAMYKLLNKHIYFAPGDRLISLGEIDLKDNVLPDFATLSGTDFNFFNHTKHDCYLESAYAEKINKLDKGWSTSVNGTFYRVTIVGMTNNKGLLAAKSNYVIDHNGLIDAAIFYKNIQMPYGRNQIIKHFGFREASEGRTAFTTTPLAVPINFYNDSRFLWNVQASEGKTKAMFGVYEEQIQSLFYARDLPQSATGRKRPILHWVNAHKRRIKSGINVDVQKHLRGINIFEMNGTTFTISRPFKKDGNVCGK